jgi:hypothetical protein
MDERENSDQIARLGLLTPALRNQAATYHTWICFAKLSQLPWQLATAKTIDDACRTPAVAAVHGGKAEVSSKNNGLAGQRSSLLATATMLGAA